VVLPGILPFGACQLWRKQRWRSETAPLREELSNFYRQHDRSFQSMIPAKRQEGEIPHEVLTSFADIMAMHSE
jgi:hypothetical protein